MRPAASIVAALALAVLPATATAAPGALDPSFSGDGWTRTLEARSASNSYLPDGADGGYARAVLVHAGRVVVGGRAFADRERDSSDWVLARYTLRGAPDRAFGAGGIAITDFGTRADEITALAAHGDKVVAAGSIYTSLGLARYMTR
jgi:hypothetical protein